MSDVAKPPPQILVVGGYGEVGSRIAGILEAAHAGTVVVAGRNPGRAATGRPARRIDVEDPAAIDAALTGVDVVVACVRQREPLLLHAAVRRGLAYTSIAPPWLAWRELERLHREAQGTGARIVAAAGLEPGISSMLARIATDRLEIIDAIETALLLGVGDAYGSDSMAFLVEELAQSYEILVDARLHPAKAFGAKTVVEFPDPIGRRLAYTMPFRDQLYYPHTLGARTSIARLALDPPWIARAISALLRFGARTLTQRAGPRDAIHRWTASLRRRYVDADRFALVVQARGGDRIVRATLSGRGQAQATAIGAAAIAHALAAREMNQPGVWLAEQVIDPDRFLARLADAGLVPTIEDPRPQTPDEAATHVARAVRSS